MKPANLTIKDLFTDHAKLTFLVGAGCSVDPPSCLPAGDKMMEAIVKYTCAESEIKKILKLKRLRFEQLVEILRDRLDPRLRIIDYYSQCDTPNLQHLFLADMIKNGNFVMTTNFDFLIEYALLQPNVSKDDIILVITQNDFEQFNNPVKLFEKGKKTLYKIHGSTKNIITGDDTRNSLVATIQALGSGKEGENVFQVEPFKRPLFDNISNNRTLVVMGYSGSDDFDIVPTLMVLKNLKNIVWINYIFDDGGSEKIYEIDDSTVQEPKKLDEVNQILVDIYRMHNADQAVLVARKILERVPKDSKILILAPTRPLIDQHRFTFLKFLNIPEEKFAILTGKIAPEKRVDIFTNNQLLFYTPQTLRNDLVSRKYTLKDTALIIFDEAHHASGDYPYAMISDELTDQNPDSIILALTASPGASKKKIVELCENLHIPLENIHIRTRKDEQVKKYIKPMDIYKIGVNLNTLMSGIYEVVNLVLEERLHYLSQLNFIDKKGDILLTKVIRKDLLRLNTELVRIVKGDGDKTGIYSALSINAQALILFHMLELIEQQGLDVLLDYLEKLNKKARKKSSSKATKILVSDNRIGRTYLELKKTQEFSPDDLIHPKYQVLVKVLLDEFSRNSDARVLVFVKLRNSVKNIVNKLKNIEAINPARFVGQATKSQDDKGLSQKRQIEILKEFKQGIYNVLVSTNVGEEGLDIAECDLVIFYDVVASEIRLIQRKGRTARHREGKVVILYCKGTHDEIYLRIALSKLKRMKIALKNPQQLQTVSYEPDMAPRIRETFMKESLDRKEETSSKKKHQTRLHQFLGNEVMSEDTVPVKISKLVPLKFGLRKNLTKEKVTFTITDSDLHIVIYNKVLIQILDPKKVDFSTLLSEIQDLKQIYSLFLVIFDFIDYRNSGESRILKRRIQELGKLHRIQFISIDNEEELLFIVKNILEHSRQAG